VALYDTSDTRENVLISLLHRTSLAGAVGAESMVDIHNPAIVVIMVSTLTGLGRSMGVVTTELAVGLLAIFRFTGIVDSAVVAAAFMMISKAFGLTHYGL